MANAYANTGPAYFDENEGFLGPANLRVGDGRDTLRHARFNNEVREIVISAYDDSGRRVHVATLRGEEAPIEAFLQKLEDGTIVIPRIEDDPGALLGIINQFADVEPDLIIDTEAPPEFGKIPDPECFAAGTMIAMADGAEKPIEAMRVGDKVLGMQETGGGGPLQVGEVTTVWSRQVDHVLDFFGTQVTPGHHFLRGDGPKEGRYQALLDILCEDGVLLRKSGARVRAATNCKVGSEGDRLIPIDWTEDGGKTFQRDRIRLGTPFLLPGRQYITVQHFIAQLGYRLTEEGLVDYGDGQPPRPFQSKVPPPRPEAYVLAVSGKTLEELRQAPDDFERSGMPIFDPASLPGLHALEADPRLQAQKSRLQLGRGYTPGEAENAPAGNRKARRHAAAARRKSKPSLH